MMKHVIYIVEYGGRGSIVDYFFSSGFSVSGFSASACWKDKAESTIDCFSALRRSDNESSSCLRCNNHDSFGNHHLPYRTHLSLTDGYILVVLIAELSVDHHIQQSLILIKLQVLVSLPLFHSYKRIVYPILSHLMS